jgi:hypothetical protein
MAVRETSLEYECATLSANSSRRFAKHRPIGLRATLACGNARRRRQAMAGTRANGLPTIRVPRRRAGGRTRCRSARAATRFEQVGFECSPRVERGERGTVFTVRDMRSDPLPIAVTAHALRQ